MVKRYLVLILLSLVVQQQATAQATVVNRLVRGTHFQAAVGYKYQQLDLQKLNQSLQAEGFPALSEHTNSIGFLTNRISNQWILSLKTFIALSNEVKWDQQEVEYRNQQYSFGVGYDVLSNEKLKLLPTVMATVGRNILLIQNKQSASPDFTKQLKSPDQEADLRNYAYMADVGLALHYQFFKVTRQKELGPKSSWVPLILKAGYQFQLGASDFKFDGETVAGVPEIGMQGFYLSAFIGFGSRMLVEK